MEWGRELIITLPGTGHAPKVMTHGLMYSLLVARLDNQPMYDTFLFVSQDITYFTMPEETACCGSHNLQDYGVKNSTGCTREATQLDQAINGLEELYQRLSSQFHLQEKVISELLWPQVEVDPGMKSPDIPSIGKVDTLHRQITKCLSMMNKVESSFSRVHTL